MTTPEVVRCSDGHFRRAIYGLGPFIADYPEQALLACIVQGWCPRYVSFHDSTSYFLMFFVRCTVKLKDIDEEGVPRSYEHREVLVEEFELGEVWHDYGIIGDVVVRFRFCFLIPNLTIQHPAIYERLSTS